MEIDLAQAKDLIWLFALIFTAGGVWFQMKSRMNSLEKDLVRTEEQLNNKLKALTHDIKAQNLEHYVAALEKGLDYEQQQLETRARLVEAEAKGDSWLQRTWRPITMLTFLVLVVADQTGVLAFRLAPEAWTLLQIGLGGYVVGRSVEKAAPAVIGALKKKEET
jgi:hypothetical protein